MPTVGNFAHRWHFLYMDTKHLLIDVRNALYRAIYASKRPGGYRQHYITIVFRQFSDWLHKYNPVSVHAFFDAPRSTVWRKLCLETYKDRDKSTFVEDISADLAKAESICIELFTALGIRQYSKKAMEADDLIYAACTVLHPNSAVIVSTDSDMTQIPYMLSSVKVYHPADAVELATPIHHPAVQKALMGDVSDSIEGYYGIGPKKSAILMENHSELKIFLEAKGKDTFVRNLLLTDLSLCPRLLNNQLYVRGVLANPVSFNKDAVSEIVKKYKLYEFAGEYHNILPRFQNLS